MDSTLDPSSPRPPEVQAAPAPASHPSAGMKTPPPPQRSSGRGVLVTLVTLAAFVTAVWQFGVQPRFTAAKALIRDSTTAELRTVIVQHPTVQPVETDLTLPATVQAFRQTTLYAQTAGYLKSWLVDIGDTVKEGQLLAEIDTPQVDQQLAQAKAALEQASANLDLAHVTANRWRELIKTHAVSSQDLDSKVTAEKADEANFAAAKANVEQLTDLQRFKHIVAPFDGTITSRLVEIGALISVGSSPTEIFHIAQTDRMLVYVNVPQVYMRSIAPNLRADLVTREYGNRSFPGTVTRTAKAIDPLSRTLLTEVIAPNKDGALLPGMYAQIRFKLINPEPAVMVPSSALVVRASGPLVAVVDSNNKYELRKVQLGRDMGAQLEITAGINLKDRVVTTPADDLTDGTPLKVQGE